jgi:disulfide bond formation protein DsbB
MLQLEFFTGRMRLLGLIAIAISILTWTAELTGMVYVCPYCRTQRTVIGLLGLLMVTPNPGFWISRYVGAVLAVFGLVVGSTQHFAGWRRIMKGEFVLSPKVYDDAFLLSGAAIFIITAQVLLLYAYRKAAEAEPVTPEG